MSPNDLLFNYLDSNTGNPIPNLSVVVSINLAAFSDGKLQFSSDVIGNIKSTTNEDGDLFFNVSKLFEANEKLFYLFREKYSKNYRIGLRVTMTSQAMEIYASEVNVINLDKLEWETKSNFTGYNYSSKYDSFSPQYVSDKPTDLKTLMSKYKEQELQFLATKAQYEADIKSNLDITVEKGQEYEPDTFRKVITRILEFQKGTLNSAIEYTKQTGLTTEQQRLITINNIMNILTKMYPNVTIDDGEGIPYNKQ
jgi:hypothetical protein